MNDISALIENTVASIEQGDRLVGDVSEAMRIVADAAGRRLFGFGRVAAMIERLRFLR